MSRQGWTQEEHGAGHSISAHDSAESAMEEADEASHGSELMGSSVEESKCKSKRMMRDKSNKQFKKVKLVATNQQCQ